MLCEIVFEACSCALNRIIGDMCLTSNTCSMMCELCRVIMRRDVCVHVCGVCMCMCMCVHVCMVCSCVQCVCVCVCVNGVCIDEVCLHV